MNQGPAPTLMLFGIWGAIGLLFIIVTATAVTIIREKRKKVD